MIQKEFNIICAAIHKIIDGELHVKKVCHWVPHDLTEHKKLESVRICEKILKLLNDGEHCLISKIITNGELYIIYNYFRDKNLQDFIRKLYLIIYSLKSEE